MESSMDSKAARYAHLGGGQAITPWPGVEMRPHFGTEAMVNVVTLGPDSVAPEHDHPEEQISLILSGSFTFSIDGRTTEMGPHDAVSIPGGVVHGGRAGTNGCVMVDVFHPIREDLRAAARELGGD
jgi:quercetin dioxygenase-like cupin family protein